MTSTNGAPTQLYALSDEVRRELSLHAVSAVCPRGTRLLQCGAEADNLVILDSGSAETSVLICGKTKRIDVDGPGKVFGLHAIVSGELLHTNVICLEECSVTLVPKSAFLDLLHRKPQLYLDVAKVLSSELVAADRMIRTCARGAPPKSLSKCFRPA